MSREIRVTCVQTGPLTAEVETNLQINISMIRKAGEKKPDLVILPELSTIPCYPDSPEFDPSFLKCADIIPGRVTQLYAKEARRIGAYLVCTLLEKRVDGEYYNSAVLIDPSGNIVKGRLPNGEYVRCYRKTHLLAHNNMLEKPFFRPGPGLPVFDTEFGRLGILICYDRLYSEAWRVLCLQGAELIAIPTATTKWWTGEVEEKYVSTFKVLAMEHVVWMAATNRVGGPEKVGNHELYYLGRSCIIDPCGDPVTVGKEDAPEIVTADIDLDKVQWARTHIHPRYRDRRPDLYGPLTSTDWY